MGPEEFNVEPIFGPIFVGLTGLTHDPTCIKHGVLWCFMVFSCLTLAMLLCLFRSRVLDGISAKLGWEHRSNWSSGSPHLSSKQMFLQAVCN